MLRRKIPQNILQNQVLRENQLRMANPVHRIKRVVTAVMSMGNT